MIRNLEQFAALTRLGSLPVEPLFEVLRDLHTRGVADSAALQALLVPDTTLTARPAIALADPARPDYEAARRHFIEHAEQVRKQAILAERLLDRLGGASEGETALHHELDVECAARGTSRMSFVVANTLDRALVVSFRVGHVLGEQREIDGATLVSFDPAAPQLGPREEGVIQLSVDLREYDGAAKTLELGVDVLGSGRLLTKVCVRICIRE